MRRVAVIDIGKTNAKIALVNLDDLSETVIAHTPNEVRADGPYPHFDTELLWEFILNGLAAFPADAKPEAISVTTHGASSALITADGTLALPVLDYEFAGPDSLVERYGDVRPSFAETGSPRLPAGLNLGAQLFWQATIFPAEFKQVATILTYPQYWAYRLCGVAANEATSLGTHTDLWNPLLGDYSSLVGRMGWGSRMAPVCKAGDRLGTLHADLAARVGFSPQTAVMCGIHDSNASLYPHLLGRKAPFAVVSTGTWVVVMAVGGIAKALDPTRDTLINVNAFGDPVPSARFMGGREFSTLLGDVPTEATEPDIARVLATPYLLTPSIESRSGPFQGRVAQGVPSQDLTPGERFAVVSFYLALMTSVCLDLVGAQGDVVVEGPFGKNVCFLKMLATATGRDVVVAKGSTGTSIGAALLCDEGRCRARQVTDTRVSPEAGWKAYAVEWQRVVADRG